MRHDRTSKRSVRAHPLTRQRTWDGVKSRSTPKMVLSTSGLAKRRAHRPQEVFMWNSNTVGKANRRSLVRLNGFWGLRRHHALGLAEHTTDVIEIRIDYWNCQQGQKQRERLAANGQDRDGSSFFRARPGG